MWWLERIEPLLGAVHVLAGPRELVLVDLRLRARARDVRDGVGAEQHQAPFPDLEVETVERADRRPRGAVALRVVLTAVTRAPEAGGRDRDDAHPPVWG